MIYTQQRRRAMNKIVRAMYPDIVFYESPNGVPVMECSTLPKGSVQIMNAASFISELNARLKKKNEMGLSVTDYNLTLPVFIRSMELSGNETRHYYRINYVSASEISQRKAEQYIADGKLYAVINQDICNP